MTGGLSALRPNRAEILELFKDVIPDQIHLVAIHGEDGDITGHDFGTDAEAAADWAISQNMGGYGVYFSVNRVRAGLHKKAAKADIIGIRFAHCDIDPPKGRSDWSPNEVIDGLWNAAVPPSTINFSGNGVQPLWRVEGAAVEDAEAINRGIMAKYEGDAGTWNADRILRVPGTINWPNAKKLASGRVPALAKIVFPVEGVTYTAGELAGAYPPHVKTREPLAAGDLGDIGHLTADSLGLHIGDDLRELIESPKGVDRSADTYAFTCEALRQGLGPEQVVAVLLNPENAIAEHCLGQADPLRAAKRAVERAAGESDVARRLRQRDEDKRIGGGLQGADAFPTARQWSLEEMVQRFVFIADGSQVADIENPRGVLSLADFRNQVAGSKTRVPILGKPDKFKVEQTSKLWLDHPDRKNAVTLTFHPGAPCITCDPQGRSALNMWTPVRHPEPSEDWVFRVQPFLDHVRWLWGHDADALFDWLAHIVQRPGELPTYGWLHIGRAQGLGRNWISSVLGRVLQGVTALGFDLSAALATRFNGELGGKVLAVVDEINEGAAGRKYQHAQALKKLVTEETRLINPKYGRQRVEHNACRWLIFSNSSTALPLEDEDRRFWVVRCDDQPKPSAHYEHLYRLREVPEFIASVAHWLGQRDISGFNPGQRPPMTEAKRALLERTRSEAEQTLHEIVARWPVDIITSDELDVCAGFERPRGRAWSYALERVGLLKVKEVKAPVGGGGRQRTVFYTVRNADVWKGASTDCLRAEVGRMTSTEKYMALSGDEAQAPSIDDASDQI